MDVVVTAERARLDREKSPAAVSVVTREEIERHPALNLAELLELVVGLRVSFAPGLGSSPMLQPRGFFGGGEAEYAKLLVDGVPVADAESGLVDWRQVRAVDVERIEVVRGAGSALHGDAAIGAVVAVFTRHAQGGEPRAAAVLSAGAFGTRGVADARAAPLRSRGGGARGHGPSPGPRDPNDSEEPIPCPSR